MNLLTKICKSDIDTKIGDSSYKVIGKRYETNERMMSAHLRSLVNDCGSEILLSPYIIASQICSMFRYIRDTGQFITYYPVNCGTTLYKCKDHAVSFTPINDRISEHVIGIMEKDIEKEYKLIDAMKACRHLIGVTIKDLFTKRYVNMILSQKIEIGQDPDDYCGVYNNVMSTFGADNGAKVTMFFKSILNGEILTLVIDTDNSSLVFNTLAPIVKGIFGNDGHTVINSTHPYAFNYLFTELEERYKFTIDYEDEYGPMGMLLCHKTALNKSASIKNSCSILPSIIVRKLKKSEKWSPFPKYILGEFVHNKYIKYKRIKCYEMPDTSLLPRPNIGGKYTSSEIYDFIHEMNNIDTDIEDYTVRRLVNGE